MRFAFMLSRFCFACLLLAAAFPCHADSLPVLPINKSSAITPTGYDNLVIPATGHWEIDNAAGPVSSGANNAAGTGGWKVNYTGTTKTNHGTLTVTTPTTAPAMPTNYTVSCGVYVASGPDGPDDEYGPTGTFTLVPTRPKPRPGAPYTWEGGSGGVNLANGNMMTQVPLVGWTARGGLPVSFTLSHSSQSSRSAEIAPKWIGSYDVTLVTASNGDATLTWGDEQSYTFTRTGISGGNVQYLASGGFNDTLVGNGTTPTNFDLKTTDQVDYHFVSSGTANKWQLDNIQDEHGNQIKLTYTSGVVTQIADQTTPMPYRTLTLGYVSGQLTTVKDSLATIAQTGGRIWTLHYSGGELTSITYPTLYDYFKTSPNAKINLYPTISFGYETNNSNNINSITDKNGNTVTSTYLGNSIATISDALSTPNTTTFTFNLTNTVVTDQNNHATTYNYADSRLQSVTDPHTLQTQQLQRPIRIMTTTTTSPA